MNKTIEISLNYSLNGYSVWTHTYSQEKDKMEYGHETYKSLKARKEAVNNFVEKHTRFYEKKPSRRKVLKEYGVKGGWEFRITIRDSWSISNWHGFKIHSPHFNVNFEKIAKKKNYDLRYTPCFFPTHY